MDTEHLNKLIFRALKTIQNILVETRNHQLVPPIWYPPDTIPITPIKTTIEFYYLHSETRQLLKVIYYPEYNLNKVKLEPPSTIVIFNVKKEPHKSILDMKFEFFCLHELAFNKNDWLAGEKFRYEKLSDEDKRKLAKKYGSHRLPCVLHNEAVIRTMGLQVNDEVKVIRMYESNNYYRRVIPPPIGKDMS